MWGQSEENRHTMAVGTIFVDAVCTERERRCKLADGNNCASTDVERQQTWCNDEHNVLHIHWTEPVRCTTHEHAGVFEFDVTNGERVMFNNPVSFPSDVHRLPVLGPSNQRRRCQQATRAGGNGRTAGRRPAAGRIDGADKTESIANSGHVAVLVVVGSDSRWTWSSQQQVCEFWQQLHVQITRC